MRLHLQLFAVLLPIVGLGAFLWWAGRDMVQSSVRLLQFSAVAFLEILWFLQLAIYVLYKAFFICIIKLLSLM
jgi:hypothetical protein